MRSRFISIAAVAGAFALCSPAFGGLVIGLTYDGTVVTNFGGNASAFQTAFTTAANNISSQYTDNIHVNINVTTVAGSGTLGASNTTLFSSTWSNLRTVVLADKKSADDTTATGAGGSITVADPSAGADTWWVTKAQRKALGMASDDLTADGTITIGSGFTYDYDPSNGITAGSIDIVGVMMHEISEVMGRIGLAGGTIGGGPGLTLLDAYSYSGANTRGLGNGAGNSFSIDNGTTLVKAFNNQAGLGGDSRDWASGTNDSFNAFSSSSVVDGLTATDIRELDVLGYDLASVATPEPSTGVLLITALGVGGMLRRRMSLR